MMGFSNTYRPQDMKVAEGICDGGNIAVNDKET
jgi:hypothetical protein